MMYLHFVIVLLFSTTSSVKLPFIFQDDVTGPVGKSHEDEAIVNHTDINFLVAAGFDAVPPQGSSKKASADSPEFLHHSLQKASEKARRISSLALRQINIQEELKKRFNVDSEDFRVTLGTSFLSTVMNDTCIEEKINCDKNAKYRSINGSCNNLEHPGWGQAFTPLQRLLPSAFQDGIWKIPKSKNLTDLPSARKISTTLAPDDLDIYEDKNILLTFFGQLLDHDITLVPIFGGEDNASMSCCTSDGLFLSDAHTACMPIEIPVDDPHYNRTCMHFVRSVLAPKLSCRLGSAEQMTVVTPYLDGSMIYGSSDFEASSLRRFSGGRLRSSTIDGMEMMPIQFHEETCGKPENHKYCFLAGDTRANEQPFLTLYHTLWLRQHNRIARLLSQVNSHWTDEVLFQETRKIVIAQLQHITYKQFLPIVLGADYLKLYGLENETTYYPTINSGISNEFASVAFRFGHSLIQAFFMLRSGDAVTGAESLRSQFGNPSVLYRKKSLLQLLEGGLQQQAMKVDNKFTKEITNHLFERQESSVGMDLIALDIQRSRDHGIPSYNQYRRLCGLKVAQDFNDLSDHISADRVLLLKESYDSVDDIELYAGGIMEDGVEGALVGPVFHCIISDQFARLKIGDRFFYDVPGVFTKDQLAEIQKTTLSLILCKNTDLRKIQANAFYLPSSTSLTAPCEEFQDLNLHFWREAHN